MGWIIVKENKYFNSRTHWHRWNIMPEEAEIFIDEDDAIGLAEIWEAEVFEIEIKVIRRIK